TILTTNRRSVTNLRSRLSASGTVWPLSSMRGDSWHASGLFPGQDEDGPHGGYERMDARSWSCSDSNSYSHDDDDDDDEDGMMPEFSPKQCQQCLFCGAISASFELNAQHMSRAHSFSIPQQDSLLVDLQTLTWYLHLVIYAYRECILCGKTGRSVQGIQQHMGAKAHCRFNMAGDMLEFYDLADVAAHKTEEVSGSSGVAAAVMRLPSGKTIASQTLPARVRALVGERKGTSLLGTNPTSRPANKLDHNDDNDDEPHKETDSGSAVLPRTRHESALARLSTQLSQFRLGDQACLARLPASQLRSVLASRMKQLSQAERAERRWAGRLDAKNNRNLMKHFKNDVPGRLNG
ncbi:hypothetical protein E4U55_001155, partial [Claviceps digitariae]